MLYEFELDGRRPEIVLLSDSELEALKTRLVELQLPYRLQSYQMRGYHSYASLMATLARR